MFTPVPDHQLREFILSPDLAALAEELTSPPMSVSEPTPQLTDVLRKRVPGGLAPHLPIVSACVVGTAKARKLGKWLSGWLFTPLGAEQSTHPAIAAYHASHYTSTHTILEVCGGCGVDTAALARAGEKVVTYEADPLTACVLEGNLIRAGISNVEVRNTAWTVESHRGADGLWADPSRRHGRGTRSREGDLYNPSLADVLNAIQKSSVSVGGVKVGPGDAIDHNNAFRSEFIAWKSECKERILWFRHAHEINTTDVVLVGASNSLLRYPGGSCLNTEYNPVSCPNIEPGMFVVEPHAAIIAGGLVSLLFTQIDALPVDKQIAYGICMSKPAVHPLYETYRIVDICTGIRQKWLRSKVRELHLNVATHIKKRGWNGNPEALRKTLPFTSDSTVRSHVIIIARQGNGHITMICEVV